MDIEKIAELVAIAEAKGDFEKSFQLYKKAAEMGNAVAMGEVAAMYAAGKGIEKNFDEAMRWYLKAAEKGDPISMAILARIYELGIDGVEQNIHEALKWYVEAANAGEPHARQRLEILFKEGR